MLKVQVAIAFFAIVTMIVSSAVGVYVGVDRAQSILARQKAAAASLTDYYVLWAYSEQLLSLIGESVFASSATPEQAKAIRSVIIAKVQDAKRAVAVETVSAARDVEAIREEAEEMATLAFLEVNLRQALDLLDQAIKGSLIADKAWARALALLHGSPGDGYRVRLDRLIAEEREQIDKAVASSDAMVALLKKVAMIYGLACVLLAWLLSRYFIKRIRGPFAALLQGTNDLAKGNLGARIAVPSHDEFHLIADNINTIAVHRQENRAALIAEQQKLEGVVNTRTDELRQAMERLSLVDRLRRDLFADISHELRTPLTAIRGEAEVALRHKVQGDAYHRAALTRVIEISGQLARLIDDLLFLSRADAASHRMNMSVITLRKLLESVCAEAKTLATEQTQEANIVLENGDPDVKVFADYDRLHQLFIILIDNALCYSEAFVDIRIKYRVGGNSVIIEVSDRGSGMSPAELSTAFLRFHRGENAQERRSGGLGLGLPIAKAIVDAHDGTIKIDSKQGAGTTVSVTLNVARDLRVVA